MQQASGGFLDILRGVASTVTETAGETFALATQVGTQRAREVVSSFLDVQEPAPQFLFTDGGVAVPGRPFNNPSGALSNIQTRTGSNSANVSDRNNEGAQPTTDSGIAGLFGFRGSVGGIPLPILIGGGVLVLGLGFIALRR